MRSDITRLVSPEGPGPHINSGEHRYRCQWQKMLHGFCRACPSDQNYGSANRVRLVTTERQSTASQRLLHPFKLLLTRGGIGKRLVLTKLPKASSAAAMRHPTILVSRHGVNWICRAAAAEFHLRMGNLAEARRTIELD